MMLKIIFCIFVLVSTQIGYNLGAKEPLPIVMWHREGQIASSLDSFKDLVEHYLGQKIYAKSIQIGKDSTDDYRSGYFCHPSAHNQPPDQVQQACEMIASDPKLKNGYNAVGFGQGAIFLRAVAQKCPEPRINNLISLGGQHQGINDFVKCHNLPNFDCERFIRSIKRGSGYVWPYIVQTSYWHDPLYEDQYKYSNSMLAEINNEAKINQQYVDNLKKLNKFVLVKFLNDSYVRPVESEWFQYFTPGQNIEIQPLNNSNAAKNLGLNDLVASKKMVFLETIGDFMSFTNEWFKENLMPYLNGEL